MKQQPHQDKEQLQQQIIEQIERYVYAVGQNLSPKIRDEITLELTSHIWDAVDGHIGPDGEATLKDIEDVLLALGSPIVIAKQYGSVGGQLIGPALFDTYKLVVSIAMIASMIGVAIANLITPDFWSYSDRFVQGIIQLFTEVFSTGISSFGMVTLIFAIIERQMGSDTTQTLLSKQAISEWHPSKLPAVPAPVHRIKRSDAITDLITTGVGLIFVIQFLPGLLKITMKDSSGQIISIPMMSADALQPYIWLISGILIVQLALSFYNLITREWSSGTRLLDIILSLSFLGIFYAFITDSAVVIPNALNSIELYRPELADLVFKGTSTAMVSVFAVVSIISFFSIGGHIYKGFIKKF